MANMQHIYRDIHILDNHIYEYRNIQTHISKISKKKYDFILVFYGVRKMSLPLNTPQLKLTVICWFTF